MMDDLTDIREFYNAAWDAEANRLERHQLEADITWRYLNLYLPPRGRLLEIGFGTGFYTFSLAKRGYQITAIDGILHLFSGWNSYSESVQNKAPWLHPDTYSTLDKDQMIKKRGTVKHNGDCSPTLWPAGFGQDHFCSGT